MSIHRSFAVPRPLLSFFDGLSDPAKGIALALISNALFILVGVIVRELSQTIDIFQILLFRQLVFVTLLMPSIISNIDAMLHPKMVSMHIWRVTGAFIALYFSFLTVSNIPFADATALGFLKVLFVAVISRLFLKENVGWARMTTILVGFTGVMLVVQPTLESESLFYVGTGLVAALGAAIAVICVRKMANVESKTVVLAYQAIFVGAVALIPAIIEWQWPTWSELALLVLVGVISSIGQWFGVTAYKWGEANVVSNVEYSQMIYSMVLGYLLFAELPNSLALIGASVILFSAILPFIIKAKQKQ
ncbi:DMT family transporter [Vibrio sp. Isolate22]|uniref:DMT family transporter n=1 Tax=Vibrio sp. Isolate22 TaxID=2908532 RepID=UPI001EFD3C77|nr:DMT family transporter [Vibrio sp. Isolate22]MCG9690246.1 DMT family transporter [Vibrio sp. Isolate22]